MHDIRRDMLGRAARGEGTGHADDDAVRLLELLGQIDLVGRGVLPQGGEVGDRGACADEGWAGGVEAAHGGEPLGCGEGWAQGSSERHFGEDEG